MSHLESKRYKTIEIICARCKKHSKYNYVKTVSFDRMTGHIYTDGRLLACSHCQSTQMSD